MHNGSGAYSIVNAFFCNMDNSYFELVHYRSELFSYEYNIFLYS